MSINKFTICTAVLTVTIVFNTGSSVARDMLVVQGAPTNNKGFQTLKKQILNLRTEIPGIGSRQLRIRLLTIEPGGHIKVHSHANRPAAFYVIQGATTITYGDGTVKRFSAGNMGYANKNTVHWHRNIEKEPVVFLAADIFQPKQK